ncbi:MAG: arginine deiminase-related protein [Gemmatimonadales bacterium]
MSARAASHVLLIAPHRYRTNAETAESNAFQKSVSKTEANRLGALAERQHAALRALLIANGVRITVARALETTPDAPFCNNWFSTHAAAGSAERRLALYPMLAPSRRLERREDLIRMLSAGYGSVVDLSRREEEETYLESTGSLVLDETSRVAYAAVSPRTDLAVAREWAGLMGFRLVAFRATDAGGIPYYHTNVMMFIGHGQAGICLDAVAETGGDGLSSRGEVLASLEKNGLDIVPIARKQLLDFCGNCLALSNDRDEPLFVMSSRAYKGFSNPQRKALSSRAKLLHTDLSAFETLGGGSARCLLGELF